ncbi:MAG: hypothetical protein A2Z99_06090 [Treponema sp. GWB1_62_6]|nr:MAG: hypothetical protein A2Z99_06090 [Treponema sp. GWB1_62_6]
MRKVLFLISVLILASVVLGDSEFRLTLPFTGGTVDNLLATDITTQQVTAPATAPSAVPGVAGLPNGDYTYVVTYYASTATHETTPSAASAPVTLANEQATVTIPVAPSGAVVGRKLYRTIAGPGPAHLLVATIANNTATTYTDNVADGALGAAAPTRNTTGTVSIAGDLAVSGVSTVTTTNANAFLVELANGTDTLQVNTAAATPTVTVTGNIAVTGTVDGVDLAGFNAAQFITLAVDANMANERVLTGGGGLTLTDAGAGLAATLAVGAGDGLTVNADDVALTTPGTLTVSSLNAAAGSHTHAVTSSSAPGAAAALLASDAGGGLDLTDFLSLTKDSIGATQVDTSGIALLNTTVAAAGAQQYSPALRFSGQGWKTDAVAGSQEVEFRMYAAPVQGAANPSGGLWFESSLNGGAYGNPIKLMSTGNIAFADNAGIQWTTGDANVRIVGSRTGSSLTFYTGNTSQLNIDSGGTTTLKRVILAPVATSGTPSATGSWFSQSAQTFTDSATAASGTAALWVGNSWASHTLAATNLTVTTTAAIGNDFLPPVAGTNQTLSNIWSARFQGNLLVTGNQTVLSADPPASATAALLRLGDNALVGGSASGTALGVNLDGGFAGNPIDVQIGGASIFKVSGGVNPILTQYGYITAGTANRYFTFQMEDTNDEAVWASENNANHEGLTVRLMEDNQNFRVRNASGTVRFFIGNEWWDIATTSGYCPDIGYNHPAWDAPAGFANSVASDIKFKVTGSIHTQNGPMQMWSASGFDTLIGSTTGKIVLQPGTGVRVGPNGSPAPAELLSVFSGNAEIADPTDLGSESLTNPNLTAGTSWTAAGDMALAADAATYTHATGSGTLTQASGDFAVAAVANRWYKFTYTVSAVTTGCTAVIPNTFASASTALTLTAGAQTTYFQAASSPADFQIAVTSTAGAVTFDTFSLKEIQGGDVIVNGLITGGGTDGIRVEADGDVIFDNSGTNANSHSFFLRGDAGGTELEAALQLIQGADPYLRFSVDDDSATPALTAVFDVHDTSVVFTTDNLVDIGGAADNRPKDYHGAGNVTVGGNIQATGWIRPAVGTDAPGSPTDGCLWFDADGGANGTGGWYGYDGGAAAWVLIASCPA